MGGWGSCRERVREAGCQFVGSYSHRDILLQSIAGISPRLYSPAQLTRAGACRRWLSEQSMPLTELFPLPFWEFEVCSMCSRKPCSNGSPWSFTTARVANQENRLRLWGSRDHGYSRLAGSFLHWCTFEASVAVIIAVLCLFVREGSSDAIEF